MTCTMASCGMCGRCSEPWGEETEPERFFCIRCDRECELDDLEPFCSCACRDNYDGPQDTEAWSGGFASNH